MCGAEKILWRIYHNPLLAPSLEVSLSLSGQVTNYLCVGGLRERLLKFCNVKNELDAKRNGRKW